MKGIFVGAKVVRIGDKSPFGVVSFIPSGKEVVDDQQFVSKKGDTIEVSSIGMAEELSMPVDLFKVCRGLSPGILCEFSLEPDPRNFQRVRVAAIEPSK